MSETKSNVASVLKSVRKQYGENTVTIGGTLVNPDRVPTGVFEFDLASGGGFPRGCLSIVYGPESAGKTNLTLLAIAQHQKKFPDLVCVFIDIENSLNLEWAKTLGVDIDKLVVIHPDFAENAADIIEGLLNAEDIGMIVLDSVAAICTIAESKKSAEEAMFGGAGAVMGRLSHKSGLAMVRQAKEGRQPTLIYISQTRMKMGLVFGNPETFSGGNAMKFQSQLTVRVAGKNVMIDKISKTMPVVKETSFTLTKWKVAVTAAQGVFRLVTIGHDGFAAGELNDIATLIQMLKAYSFMAKVKGGWQISGSDEVFPNGDSVVAGLKTNKEWANKLRKSLIDLAIKTGPLLSKDDDDE